MVENCIFIFIVYIEETPEYRLQGKLSHFFNLTLTVRLALDTVIVYIEYMIRLMFCSGIA